MHALQPMQRRIASCTPFRALRGSSGSVISARVIPTASARPSRTRRSASTGSTTRDVAISGTPSRNGSVQIADRVFGLGRRRDDLERAAIRRRVSERHVQEVDSVGDALRGAQSRSCVGREAHTERQPRRGAAHRGDHGQEEARPVLPLVLAAVQLGREELRDRDSCAPPTARFRRARRPRPALPRARSPATIDSISSTRSARGSR